MNINMYERYAIRDVWFCGKNGEIRPILIHSYLGRIKDLVTDKVCGPTTYGPATHISKIVKENLRPNQIYKSKLMQDCLKLMEQANWNKETFQYLWNIVYGNGITTREEVLQVAREIELQNYQESVRHAQASKVSNETAMNF